MTRKPPFCWQIYGFPPNSWYKNFRNTWETIEAKAVIDGGCYAQFGSYGPQDGDGIPTISGEGQIRQTAEAIAAFAVQ